MERLLEFAGNHLLLVAAFVILSGMLIASFMKEAIGGAKNLSTGFAVRLINDHDPIVIDLRDKKDWDRGHIVDAVHIPYASLSEKIPAAAPDKARPLLLYCASGAIAARSLPQLKQAGYENIYTLKGGILSWQADSLPLERA